MGSRACYRTALEICKVLLNLVILIILVSDWLEMLILISDWLKNVITDRMDYDFAPNCYKFASNFLTNWRLILVFFPILEI